LAARLANPYPADGGGVNSIAPAVQQGAQGVRDLGWVARVGHAIRQSPGEPDPAIDLPEQQGPGIGGEPAAIEIRHDLQSLEPGKEELLAGTLCHQEASLAC
jgi:hypothetical protein